MRCDPVTEDDCTVVVVEDGAERELTRIDYGNPAWSPDGSEIAVVRCADVEESTCGIFTVPAEGGRLRRVTPNFLFGQPVWSPDGRSIAFETTPHGMFVVAADGTGVLWSTYALDSDPNWSPDGRQIAFTRSKRVVADLSRHDVYVVNSDGTGARRITVGDASTASPAWSPDGTQLAFVQWTGSGECPASALFVSDADGGNRRQLTSEREWAADPAWSPEGREIAYARTEECWSEEAAPLWLVPPEGGPPRPVSPPARPDAGVDFAWRPAS